MHKLRHHKVQNIPKDLLNPTLLFQNGPFKNDLINNKGKNRQNMLLTRNLFLLLLICFYQIISVKNMRKS